MFLKLVLTGAVLSTLALRVASAQDLPLLTDLQGPQTSANSVLDEPIRQIADTVGGCAVLDKDFPGLRQHSMYPFFKSMSLNQIAAMSKGQITSDMLAQAQTDLTALDAIKAPVAGLVPAGATTVAATAP